MPDIDNSDIKVDVLMHEIRETVARRRREAGHNGAAPVSSLVPVFKAASQSPGDSPSLTLQPEFHSRHDNNYHVNDLLKYHGADFVRNAYLALLKREPDAAGYARHLEELASGRFNKIDILSSLSHSPEGRRAQVPIAGLKWPNTIRRLERLPVIGYLIQTAIAIGRLPVRLEHQRQFEVYLLSQQQRIVDHDNQVHQKLAEAAARLSEQISEQIRVTTEAGARQQEIIESLLQQQKAAVERHVEFEKVMATRFGETEEQLEQRTATLRQQITEQAGELSGRQQELTRQMEEQLKEHRAQAEELLGQQHQTHRELIAQERRLTLLIEETRKHSPGSLAQPVFQQLVREEEHLLDPLYASLEEQFRGSREEIKGRLQVYVPILKNAEIKDGVLDVGCGRGEWLQILRDEGVKAQGIDHNRVFVEECRQQGFDVIEGDAVAHLSSIPAGSLNVVTSFHLVEHLEFENLVRMLDEMIRTLRVGGCLILETPNPENLIVGSCNFYADPTHRNPIPAPTLQFLLQSRGLSRIEVMKLRPWEAARIEGDTEIIKRFNEYFYGAPDYGIIGWKI